MARQGFKLNSDTLDAVYARWGEQLPAREQLENDAAHERVTTIMICRRHGAAAYDAGIGGLFNSPDDAVTWFPLARGIPLLLIDLTAWPCEAVITIDTKITHGARAFTLDWTDPATPSAALYPGGLLTQIAAEYDGDHGT